MNTKLIISICLVLVSMIGVGCVSAANNQTSVQTNVEEMNVEMENEENLIQTQSESIKQEKTVNRVGLSERNFINGNGPFYNGIKDHSNIKNNHTIKCGVNNTNNSNNKTIKGPKVKPKLDIKGPKTNGSNLNISGPKIKPKGDIKGPKINVTTKIKGPKIDEPKILNKSKTFNYNGEKVYLALMQNGSERKLCIFKASGSGMGGAGSSYVGEIGSEIVDILEREGVIDKMAYGAAWLQAKITFKIMEWMGEDTSGWNEQFFINYWAFGKNTEKYIWK